MTMPAEIEDLGAESVHIAMCITSQSGWGKTVLAGTAPNALILSADPEGTDSALFAGSTAKQWKIRSYDDIDKAYRWLRDEGSSQFDWLCIDSVTEMQKLLMDSALAKAFANNPKRDPDVPSVDAYQKVQIQTLKMAKKFNDLPMHKLWTALPMRQEFLDAEGEEVVQYLPYVHGGRGEIAHQFMGYMKVQGYGVYHDKKVKVGGKVETRRVRRTYFQTHGPYLAKDRYYGALGDFRDDVTIGDIQETVEKRLAELRSNTPTRKRATARK